MIFNSLLFKWIIDIAMVGLGSYGVYIFIGEFVELKRFPSFSQFMQILQRRWFAAIAVVTAFTLFFLRVYEGLAR